MDVSVCPPVLVEYGLGMTLICTVISNLGIVQSSDSNITGGPKPEGTKVFPLRFSRGALALAGAYQIGNELMDVWMSKFIDSYASAVTPTLQGFGELLKERLTEEWTAGDASGMSMIQVADYVPDAGGIHPEMHWISNVSGINEKTTDYEGCSNQFAHAEHFWQRDYSDPNVRDDFAAGGYIKYFNGFTPGRIAFNGVSKMLDEFFRQAWSRSEWKFRPPRSLDELASIVELQIRAVTTLFGTSDYDPYIGGKIQQELIAPPLGAVIL